MRKKDNADLIVTRLIIYLLTYFSIFKMVMIANYKEIKSEIDA